MNENCNHPAETRLTPPPPTPEDKEKILLAEIQQQRNIIAVAIGYLRTGEPHLARQVLEAAKL